MKSSTLIGVGILGVGAYLLFTSNALRQALGLPAVANGGPGGTGLFSNSTTTAPLVTAGTSALARLFNSLAPVSQPQPVSPATPTVPKSSGLSAGASGGSPVTAATSSNVGGPPGAVGNIQPTTGPTISGSQYCNTITCCCTSCCSPCCLPQCSYCSCGGCS